MLNAYRHILWRGYEKKSIKIKLLAYLGSVLFIGNLVSLLGNANLTQKLLLERESEMLQITASRSADIVSAKLQEINNVLVTVSRRSELMSEELSAYEKSQVLEREVTTVGCREIGYVDAKGIYTNAAGEIIDISEKSSYYSMLNGKISYGELENINGIMTMMIMVPVYNESGVMIGGIQACQQLTAINQVIDHEDIEGFIVASNGTLVAHSSDELVQIQTNVMQEATKDATYTTLAEVYKQMVLGNEDVTSFIDPTSKEEYIVSYTPIPDTDWSIAIMEEKKQVTLEIKAITLKITGFMANVL